MTSKTFSQSITKDSVTTHKETFKLIMKDLRKCDSLKIAYLKINTEFDSLIVSNNTMFKDFEQTRAEKIKLQGELDQKERDFHKLFQKPTRGWLVPLSIGAVIGVLVANQ